MSLLNAILVFAEKTPDEEGRDIVLMMLAVGLVFLAVIAIGELSRYIAHRKGRR